MNFKISPFKLSRSKSINYQDLISKKSFNKISKLNLNLSSDRRKNFQKSTRSKSKKDTTDGKKKNNIDYAMLKRNYSCLDNFKYFHLNSKKTFDKDKVISNAEKKLKNNNIIEKLNDDIKRRNYSKIAIETDIQSKNPKKMSLIYYPKIKLQFPCSSTNKLKNVDYLAKEIIILNNSNDELVKKCIHQHQRELTVQEEKGLINRLNKFTEKCSKKIKILKEKKRFNEESERKQFFKPKLISKQFGVSKVFKDINCLGYNNKINKAMSSNSNINAYEVDAMVSRIPSTSRISTMKSLNNLNANYEKLENSKFSNKNESQLKFELNKNKPTIQEERIVNRNITNSQAKFNLKTCIKTNAKAIIDSLNNSKRNQFDSKIPPFNNLNVKVIKSKNKNKLKEVPRNNQPLLNPINVSAALDIYKLSVI